MVNKLSLNVKELTFLQSELTRVMRRLSFVALVTFVVFPLYRLWSGQMASAQAFYIRPKSAAISGFAAGREIIGNM